MAELVPLSFSLFLSLRQVPFIARTTPTSRRESGRPSASAGVTRWKRIGVSIYLGPGLRGPLLLGGALDLRIVRIVHLVIVLVRIVLDLLHAALARNVCRFSETLSTRKKRRYAGDTRLARTARNRRRTNRRAHGISQTIWRSVREEGGGTLPLLSRYARTAWRRGCGNRLPMAAPFTFGLIRTGFRR